MGYSLRTDTPFPLRFTMWVRWNVTRPLWDEVFAREFYNHSGDTGDAFTTDAFENENQAADPALAELVAVLSAQLRREFSPYIFANQPSGRSALKTDDKQPNPPLWPATVHVFGPDSKDINATVQALYANQDVYDTAFP